jgi:hypothetical protein
MGREGRPHGVDGLHGDGRRPGRDELSRKLPGACANVDDGRVRTDSQRFDKPGNRFEGIGGTAALVRVRGSAEALRGDRVHATTILSAFELIRVARRVRTRASSIGGYR